MKVEIAEHLIGRWLRHVVGCRLVEPFLPPGQKLASGSQSGRQSHGTAQASAPVLARVRSRERDMGDKSEALVAAYYLFRFDHHRLGQGNQGETFKQLARELGVKKSTLKNQRDFFDSHSGSHREGWKKPMNAAQQAVFDKYVRYSEAELRAELEALIKSGT